MISNEAAFPLHKLWNTVLKTQDYAAATSNNVCDIASNNARSNTCQTVISKLNIKITEMIKNRSSNKEDVDEHGRKCFIRKEEMDVQPLWDKQ